MKKLISLLISLIMVFSVFAVLSVPVSAAPTNVTINAINPEYVEGVTAIFTPAHGETLQAGSENTYAWWDAVVFVKDGDGYKVTEVYTTDAAAAKGSVAIPADGFVVAGNAGNNWPKLIADWEANPVGDTPWYYNDEHKSKPNYTSEKNQAAMDALKLLSVGDIMYLDGIDLENATIDDNSSDEIFWYSDDYVSKAKLSTTPILAKDPRVNAALGKSYTTVGIYSDTAGAFPYPDEDGVTLTDGKFADEVKFSDSAWVGFNLGSPDFADYGDNAKLSSITVDLGKATNLSGFSLFVYDGHGDAGINAPKVVEFFYSSNGTDWTSAGNGALAFESTEKCNNAFVLDIDAKEARYVKAVAEHGGNWLFISEFAAYSTETAPVEDSSTEPVESSKQPVTSDTSDAGIMTIAIISMIALAGAVIVKKVR